MNFRIRATLVAVLGLALSAAPSGAQGSSPKIVFVNTSALLQVAPGRAAAESTYAKDTQAWSDELNKMGQDVQTMITDYQTALAKKGADSLTDAAKKNRTSQIQAKQQAYADRQSQLQQQALDRQNELMAPVMQTVKETLEKVREEKGYSLILDSQAVVAEDKNLDITDDVVARLKIAAAAKKDAPATPAPKKAGGG
jgi:outer membrane protein